MEFCSEILYNDRRMYKSFSTTMTTMTTRREMTEVQPIIIFVHRNGLVLRLVFYRMRYYVNCTISRIITILTYSALAREWFSANASSNSFSRRCLRLAFLCCPSPLTIRTINWYFGLNYLIIWSNHLISPPLPPITDPIILSIRAIHNVLKQSFFLHTHT